MDGRVDMDGVDLGILQEFLVVGVALWDDPHMASANIYSVVMFPLFDIVNPLL